MWFPSLSSEYLRDALQPIISELLDSADAQESGAVDLPDPLLLSGAFERLAELLARAETGQTATATHDGAALEQVQAPSTLQPHAITELGEYTFVLLNNLNRWVTRLKLPVDEASLMELAIVVALWVSQNGGELLTLEPVADALAHFSNSTSDTNRLEELYVVYDKIISAVATGIQQDLEKINPGRPWRVLNMNRAIVATRCHKTDLMESSFESLIKWFPDDTADFFRKGMGQMDALNYPDQVRTVMGKYYSRCTVKPSMH